MPRPIVGVTGGELTPDRQKRQHALRVALHKAGCVPVLLRSDERPGALARVHAVVLPGGGDIDPRRYGRDPMAEIRDPDPEREEFEIELVREAVAQGVPTIGICRGMQILTVALGGTLTQHVPNHEDTSHDVRLEPDAALARIVGATTLTTNSNHHQAPAEMPPLLRATGRTRDGVIEAVEGPGFTIGVGWHLETMTDPSSARLFEAFVAAALRRTEASPRRVES
jgi:putative glutamine amidotransferase